VSAHLTDVELRRLADGSLAAGDLLRADDHLSACGDCRARAAALNGAAAAVDALRSQIDMPTMHLSDDEVLLFVQGQLEPGRRDDVIGHVGDCVTCAQQIDELRAWSHTSATPVRSRALTVAAAIVIGLLIPAVVWMVRSGRQGAEAVPGFDALAPAEQNQVRAALAAGVATLPDFMADVNGSREALMGTAKTAVTFALTAPVGTATASDRPRFDWQPLEGAREYIVSVYDEQSNLIVSSPAITETTWVPAQPLPRGRTYVWQVAASRGESTITVPVAPAPPARFHVVDAHAAEVIAQMKAEHPEAHLVLGILSMNAGLRDEAVQQLRQIPSTDPGFDLASRSLERVR